MNHNFFFLSSLLTILVLTDIGHTGGLPDFLSMEAEVTHSKAAQFLDEIQRKAVQAPLMTRYKTTFKTKDGIKRNAIVTLRKNAKGNVVLCHPAARNKEYMKDYDDKLFDEYNSIRFDFRRHGEESKQQYSTIGIKEALEVEAAFKILKSHDSTRDLPTYGFGISMGAAALIVAESKKPMFDGLIIQSCYESLRKQIKRMFSFYRIPLMEHLIFTKPIRLYSKTRYKIKLKENDLVRKIQKIKTPIFMIHALNDSFIPITAFHSLKRVASNIKQVWTPEDGKHTHILDTFPKKYYKKCKEFLSKLANA